MLQFRKHTCLFNDHHAPLVPALMSSGRSTDVVVSMLRLPRKLAELHPKQRFAMNASEEHRELCPSSNNSFLAHVVIEAISAAVGELSTIRRAIASIVSRVM